MLGLIIIASVIAGSISSYLAYRRWAADRRNELAHDRVKDIGDTYRRANRAPSGNDPA